MAPTPTPGPVAVPQLNANPAAMYNPPRAPEVYSLADPIDGAIRKDVREQFQLDEQGHVAFFTTPPLHRPNNGVAEQYAGLGHSASHLANIKKVREERAAKRKARDETNALEEAANKKFAAQKEAVSRRRAEIEQMAMAEAGKEWLLNFVESMTDAIAQDQEALGDDFRHWQTVKYEERAAYKALTDKQRRVRSLQWLFDKQEREGLIDAKTKKEYEDIFIHRTYLEDDDTAKVAKESEKKTEADKT